MTVPSDRNIALKEIEKKSKYKDLELEIQRMWHMKAIVIPVVDKTRQLYYIFVEYITNRPGAAGSKS